MIKRRLRRYLARIKLIERHPSLRRFRRPKDGRGRLAFTRDSVARAVAIGLFFGILTPVAQIVFAVVVAIVVRANLLIAAVSTMITNPFTFPFVYYTAYRIGLVLTGRERSLAEDMVVSEEAAEHALDVPGWGSTLVEWGTSIGLPLATGVAILAVSASLTGFLIVHGIWAIRGRLRA